MDLRILGWESSGFRSPDMKVKLDAEGLKKISLIQMPNGTGKTTTLNLMKAAMTGEAQHWSPKEILIYKRKKEEGYEDIAEFKLSLSVDKVQLTFQLTFNFLDKKIFYKTTSPEIGGVVDGWRPPSKVRHFLKSEFVDLFVFDGELAAKFLNPKEDKETAEGAIDALCQLYLLDECSSKINGYWQDQTTGGARTNQGLNQWKIKREGLQTHYDKLEILRKGLENKNKSLYLKIDELDVSIKKRAALEGGVKKEYKLAVENEQKLKTILKEEADDFFDDLRKPYLIHPGFNNALLELKEKMDKHKLPRNTSTQFFNELANDTECICGREIDENARIAILNNAEKYLGEEITGTLNSIKTDIDKYTVTNNSNSFKEKRMDLDNQKHKLWLSTQDLQAIEREFNESGGKKLQDDREALLELRSEYEERKGDLEDLLGPDDGTDDMDSLNLESIYRQLKHAKDKVSEITDTVTLTNKVDTLKEILEQVKITARESIRKKLVFDCNEKLDKILPLSPLRISKIGKSLELSGQEGASAGQTLAIGYTFLTSLLNRGKNHFPLIVDSPAGPLDDGVREEIGSMIPKLCAQFVSFVIVPEREYFVPSLSDASSNDILYLTIFKNTEGAKQLIKDLPSTGVKKTNTGVMVVGEEYFNSFKLKRQ